MDNQTIELGTQNSKFFSKIEKAALPPCFLLRKSQSLPEYIGFSIPRFLTPGRILTMLSSSGELQSELDTLRKTSAGQMETIGELNGK